ncbi:MAG: hypothetical protein UH963_02470 [Agathobacter sp.]|nr:hypothetical protein [Agathobacter sp.]
MLPGVYLATKKDGTPYYRSNITYKNKHISLGSFSTERDAHQAYRAANSIINSSDSIEDSYYLTYALPFEKIVSLINYRDNNMYIPTPIYLHKSYFSYYLTISYELKFDIDDLFYYSSHKIIQRQGHLFVNDYGMQVSIQSRYGIKPYAVYGKDYIFANDDRTDYRYSNIIILNKYNGVTQIQKNDKILYKAKIKINGVFTIGTYSSEEKAAIAYNKAIDMAHTAGINKKYNENYIDTLSPKEYAQFYTQVKISPKYINYINSLTKPD